MNGILIPWPIVLLAAIIATLFVLRQLAAECAAHRLSAGILGTASFTLGIAAFAFFLTTASPRWSSVYGADDAAQSATPPAESEAPITNAKPQTPNTSEAATPEKIPAKTAESISAAATAELESPISTTKIDWDKRPKWVDQPPKDDGIHHIVAVKSGPWATATECQQKLDEKMIQATNDYIRTYLKNDHAPQLLHYDLPYIKEHLTMGSGHFDETLTVSFGEMRQAHALLAFGPEFRQSLDRGWKRVISGNRLGQTGIAFGGVLAFLATFFGYFKFDTATRGFYTGRLQFAAAAAILAIVTAGMVLAMWLPWL